MGEGTLHHAERIAALCGVSTVTAYYVIRAIRMHRRRQAEAALLPENPSDAIIEVLRQLQDGPFRFGSCLGTAMGYQGIGDVLGAAGGTPGASFVGVSEVLSDRLMHSGERDPRDATSLSASLQPPNGGVPLVDKTRAADEYSCGCYRQGGVGVGQEGMPSSRESSSLWGNAQEQRVEAFTRRAGSSRASSTVASRMILACANTGLLTHEKPTSAPLVAEEEVLAAAANGSGLDDRRRGVITVFLYRLRVAAYQPLRRVVRRVWREVLSGWERCHHGPRYLRAMAGRGVAAVTQLFVRSPPYALHASEPIRTTRDLLLAIRTGPNLQDTMEKLLEPLKPTPGRTPTVAVLRVPPDYEVSVDASALWNGLQLDSSFRDDALVDVAIVTDTDPKQFPRAASTRSVNGSEGTRGSHHEEDAAPLECPPLASAQRLIFEVYSAYEFYAYIFRCRLLQEQDQLNVALLNEGVLGSALNSQQEPKTASHLYPQTGSAPAHKHHSPSEKGSAFQMFKKRLGTLKLPTPTSTSAPNRPEAFLGSPLTLPTPLAGRTSFGLVEMQFTVRAVTPSPHPATAATPPTVNSPNADTTKSLILSDYKAFQVQERFRVVLYHATQRTSDALQKLNGVVQAVRTHWKDVWHHLEVEVGSEEDGFVGVVQRLRPWMVKGVARREEMRDVAIKELAQRAFKICSIPLKDCRVYRQTPPAVPRYVAAHARGFPLARTYAEEMLSQQHILQSILVSMVLRERMHDARRQQRRRKSEAERSRGEGGSRLRRIIHWMWRCVRPPQSPSTADFPSQETGPESGDGRQLSSSAVFRMEADDGEGDELRTSSGIASPSPPEITQPSVSTSCAAIENGLGSATLPHAPSSWSVRAASPLVSGIRRCVESLVMPVDLVDTTAVTDDASTPPLPEEPQGRRHFGSSPSPPSVVGGGGSTAGRRQGWTAINTSTNYNTAAMTGGTAVAPSSCSHQGKGSPSCEPLAALQAPHARGAVGGPPPCTCPVPHHGHLPPSPQRPSNRLESDSIVAPDSNLFGTFDAHFGHTFAVPHQAVHRQQGGGHSGWTGVVEDDTCLGSLESSAANNPANGLNGINFSNMSLEALGRFDNCGVRSLQNSVLQCHLASCQLPSNSHNLADLLGSACGPMSSGITYYYTFGDASASLFNSSIQSKPDVCELESLQNSGGSQTKPLSAFQSPCGGVSSPQPQPPGLPPRRSVSHAADDTVDNGSSYMFSYEDPAEQELEREEHRQAQARQERNHHFTSLFKHLHEVFFHTILRDPSLPATSGPTWPSGPSRSTKQRRSSFFTTLLPGAAGSALAPKRNGVGLVGGSPRLSTARRSTSEREADDDSTIVTFGSTVRQRRGLDLQNGHYGLSPFEVWLATRYSRRLAGEVYLMDVHASKGDPFYPAARVIDDVVTHAVLYYHNGSLREFLEDLEREFGLHYEPTTRWARKLMGYLVEDKEMAPQTAAAESKVVHPTVLYAATAYSASEAKPPLGGEGTGIAPPPHSTSIMEVRPLLPPDLSEVSCGSSILSPSGDVSLPRDPPVDQDSGTEGLPFPQHRRTENNAHVVFTSRRTPVPSEHTHGVSELLMELNHESFGDSEKDLGREEDAVASVAAATHHLRGRRPNPSSRRGDERQSRDTNGKHHRQRSHSGAFPSSHQRRPTADHHHGAHLPSPTFDGDPLDHVIFLAYELNKAKDGELMMGLAQLPAANHRSEAETRLLEELEYVKEFLVEHRHVLSSAMLTPSGSNRLEGVFGTPATVFPYLLCSRDSIALVQTMFDSLEHHYGSLVFESFAQYTYDVFYKDRPEIIRHAPRIFRTINKSRRGYISYEEMCAWMARKLSCGSNVKPDAHLLATAMSLRLPLSLVLGKKALWQQLQCTLGSISDGDGDY